MFCPCSVPCVPEVACVSRLSVPDCSFGFLWLVFTHAQLFYCRQSYISLPFHIGFFHFEFLIHFFNWVLSQEITIGLGLWCLMPLSTIFQLYHGGQLYWLRNQITRRKSLTYRKSLTIFITLYWIQLAWAGFEFTMLVVIRHGVIVISCNRLHFFM